MQYADYTLWQQDLLGTEDDPDSVLNAQLDYWRDTLDGLPDRIELPLDRPHPATATFRGELHTFAWDADLHTGLSALARECGASVFMVVHAALAALLTRLGAGTDVPIGSPIAGRTDQALDDLVGFFVNTLVLRVDTAGEPSFRDLVARVRERNLDAYAHQDVPFERLVELLNPARSLSYHPLFQVMIAGQNNTRAEVTLPGLTVTEIPVTTGTSKFDLSISLTEREAGIAGVLEFNADVFDHSGANAILRRLEVLLRAALAEPDRPVGALDLLAGDERDQVLTRVGRVARTGGHRDVPRPVRPPCRRGTGLRGARVRGRRADVRRGQRPRQPARAPAGRARRRAGARGRAGRAAVDRHDRRGAGRAQGRRRVPPGRRRLPRRPDRLHGRGRGPGLRRDDPGDRSEAARGRSAGARSTIRRWTECPLGTRAWWSSRRTRRT